MPSPGAPAPAHGPTQDTNYACGLDDFKAEWRATYDNGTAYTMHGGKSYMHDLR